MVYLADKIGVILAAHARLQRENGELREACQRIVDQLDGLYPENLSAESIDDLRAALTSEGRG